MTEQERFWSHVVKDPHGCWYWDGCHKRGYGKFQITRPIRKTVQAHRYSYALIKGPIPSGMEIDHLCGVPLCVNPAHLEAVTPRENNLRSNSRAAQNTRKTHCLLGHPLAGSNMQIRTYSHGPARCCRLCEAARSRKHYWAKKAEPAAMRAGR